MLFGRMKRMKPNYSLATTLAYQTLIYNNISLPIDPYKIKLQNTKIKILSMQDFSQRFNVPLEEMTQNGSCDEGYNIVQVKNGIKQATILYNEDIVSNERKRFTIAHEIGHIVLGHTEHSINNEKEADTFASQLLLPHCLLEQLVKFGKAVSESYLKEKFGLSNEAAHISKLHVGKKINANAVNDLEDIILTMYKDFIDTETYNTKYRYYEEDEEMESIRNNWY